MKACFFTLLAVMFATSGFAADGMTRSRNLSKTFPGANMVLTTDSDGRWNTWKLLTDDNMTGMSAAKLTAGTTASAIILSSCTGYSAALAATINDITATAAEANRAADISAGQRSLTVTNTQAITLSSANVVIALTSEGKATGQTNTVTLALPYPVGYNFMFRLVSGSTNLALIADATTTLSLGADVILGPTDTLVVYTAATNEAVKVSNSDN